ncbi:hypothetical protein M422DRAFT_166656, partial [Sphaerobolus stellatus SS14]
HYLWASGHFILLFFSLRYLFAYATFKSAAYTGSYKTAFFGALVSYAIVCFKALGIPSPSSAFISRALMDENVQYFILAIYWWFSKPVPIAILPYTVFSLFHTLTFVRTTILPKVYPQPAAAAGSQGPPPQSQIGKFIQTWVKSNYDSAMRITAIAEFVILFRVVLGALTLQNSFLTPIVYAHFLRQRYYHSTFTKEALGKVKSLLDKYARHPSLPPVVGQVWGHVKNAIGVWAGSTLAPQQPTGPAAS